MATVTAKVKEVADIVNMFVSGVNLSEENGKLIVSKQDADKSFKFALGQAQLQGSEFTSSKLKNKTVHLDWVEIKEGMTNVKMRIN